MRFLRSEQTVNNGKRCFPLVSILFSGLKRRVEMVKSDKLQQDGKLPGGMENGRSLDDVILGAPNFSRWPIFLRTHICAR